MLVRRFYFAKVLFHLEHFSERILVNEQLTKTMNFSRRANRKKPEEHALVFQNKSILKTNLNFFNSIIILKSRLSRNEHKCLSFDLHHSDVRRQLAFAEGFSMDQYSSVYYSIVVLIERVFPVNYRRVF